jgi:hypothetical protein
MTTAIIIWLYVVGLGISWSLFHDVRMGITTTILWPVLVPLIVVLKGAGILDRLTAWSERR